MIRNGFVSNSSSSSFIIRKPSKGLDFNEIKKFYKINPKLNSKMIAWISLIIDYHLSASNEEISWYGSSDTDWEIYDENNIPYILTSTSWEEYLVENRDEIFVTISPTEEEIRDYFERGREAFSKGYEWCHISIESYGTDFGDLKIPYSVADYIREHAEEIFLDPAKAISHSD